MNTCPMHLSSIFDAKKPAHDFFSLEEERKKEKNVGKKSLRVSIKSCASVSQVQWLNHLLTAGLTFNPS